MAAYPRRLDDRALHYFAAVHESGSVRLAAERVCISPSSISRKLAELEMDLGVVLFEKTARGVKPTAAAEMLAAYVQGRNVRDREIMLELSSQAAVRGEVRVACGEGFLASLIRDVLPPFEESYSKVRVHVEVAATGELVEAVARDLADVGIAFNPPLHPNIDVLGTAGHGLVGVGSKSFGLEDRNAASLAAFCSLPVAVLTRRSGIRTLLDDVQRSGGFSLDYVFECNSVCAICTFVEEGRGVTFLPAFAIPAALRTDVFACSLLGDAELAAVPAELFTRRGRSLSPAMQALTRHINTYHRALVAEPPL